MYYGGRDYNAIQNAGQNLVSNRGYSAYKDNRYQQDYNSNPAYNNRTNPQSSDTSRYDELDILDQYSQPLLQRQGGDLMGNLSSIQLGQNKRNNIPNNIRGSSANMRNPNPQYIPNTYPPPPPYQPQYPYQPQFAPPYMYQQKRRDSSSDASKVLQQQLDKQNDILSQLVSNIDKNKYAQMNQVSQPQPDYNNRLRDIEKEFQMMNEIQNLRREINSIQATKNNVNPQLQQQQQQFQMMQMQQQMMNPYMNPMMMMLMNQMNQQNQQQQQQPPYPPPPYGYPPYPPPPYGYPPPPPPQMNKKKDDDNRLEELLKDLLKERALNNALKRDNLQNQPYNQTRNSQQLRSFPTRNSSNQGNDYMIYTDPDQPLEDQQPNQRTNTQSTANKPKKVDTRRAKKILGYFALFIRWIKLEVIKSKAQFKQYEIEEFKADYVSAVEAALPWLINCSTKAFNAVVTNCKKEQDITDIVVKKLNVKEQDLRFTNYCDECNFILDELIRGVESMPEGLSLFIVKKFYDNSYFSNDPTILFEFELDRLEFDPQDAKLMNIDAFPDSPRFKMLFLILIFIKIYIPQILIKPWTQQLNPSIKLNENYITQKKLAISCSLIYQQIMDYLKEKVPLTQKQPNQVTWNPIPTSIVINNGRVDLKPQNNSKEELLTLLVTKDQLTTFYGKRQQWVDQFKKKLDEFATTVRQKLQTNRQTFLELRKELLQEKAKELQRFIPPRLRNVQLQ